MLAITKRALVLCLALLMILSVFPMAAFAAEEEEEAASMVQNVLDFTTMNPIGEGRNEKKDAENKQKVSDALIAAGAVACENLYLKGNWETIVNPGGYKKQGYYIQKLSALEGETLENVYLEFGYWICDKSNEWDDAEQGYIQVLVSADNENYELVWESNEGNGPPFVEYNRRTANIELPVVEGQTEIYVKFIMEHWQTYEGAGIAYSTLTGNVRSLPVESDKQPYECTMVTMNANFNALPQGEVSAEDIGAVAESSLLFGMEDVPLLCPKDGYRAASATWMLEAAEGEPLHDCILTIVGRTFWGVVEEQKANHYLKVYASVDGLNFKLAHEFRGTESEDDTQRFVVDLTEFVKGYGQAYVKLEWMMYDSPHFFGIRSVNLVGNTAGKDPTGQNTRVVVSSIQSFTGLPVGEVEKEDIGAFKSANLMFGHNKTPLLTAKKAGTDAYVTWKINAVEGEPFVDCHLTLVGKFGYVNADKKDTSSMRVYLSTDGEKYAEVLEILPTEDQSDTQKIVVDLSAQTYGMTEVYVRVYWSSKDDPAGMGLRSASLVANAGVDYDLFTPELEDRVITDAEMPTEPTQPSQPADPTEPTQPADPVEPAPDQGSIWIIVGIAAVVVIAVVVVIVVLRKKKQ